MYFDASRFSFCFVVCWKILSPAARCRTSAVCFLSFYISFLSFCACCRRFLPWTWWMGGHETISVCAADKTSKLCITEKMWSLGRKTAAASVTNHMVSIKCFLFTIQWPDCSVICQPCLVHFVAFVWILYQSLSGPAGSFQFPRRLILWSRSRKKSDCPSDSVAQSTVSNWMETNICEAIVSDSAAVPKFAVSLDAAWYHYSPRRLRRVRCISEK